MDILGSTDWNNWQKQFKFWKNWRKQFVEMHESAWSQDEIFEKFNRLKKPQNELTQDEILEKVSQLEKRFWTWNTVAIVICSVGTIILGNFGVPPLLSLFIGLPIIFATKFICSESLYNLHIIWEMRKHVEDEMLSSEIQDL